MADVQSGVRLYEPKINVVKVNGVRVYNWLRATASYNDPRHSLAESTAYGGELAIRNPSLAGSIEIELSQRGADEISTIQGLSGQGGFTVEIVDKSGTAAKAILNEAYLSDDPGLERAKDASSHTASFVGVLTFGEGGVS